MGEGDRDGFLVSAGGVVVDDEEENLSGIFGGDSFNPAAFSRKGEAVPGKLAQKFQSEVARFGLTASLRAGEEAPPAPKTIALRAFAILNFKGKGEFGKIEDFSGAGDEVGSAELVVVASVVVASIAPFGDNARKGTEARESVKKALCVLTVFLKVFGGGRVTVPGDEVEFEVLRVSGFKERFYPACV